MEIASPAVEAEPAGGTTADVQGAIARFGARFLFVFVALFTLPFPIGALPFTEKPAELWSRAQDAVVPWIAIHVFRMPGPISTAPTGSGDRLVDWVLIGSCLAAAAIVALIWSALARERKLSPWITQGLRIYVRYALAVTMLGYGWAKVFKSQFPAPSPGRLLQPYGDSSPMGLLWTFMGYSTPYTVFAGLSEVTGAVLLLFRRTATLGALITAAVLANVVMLNVSYDVPVKLFASLLLCEALLLISWDAKRLLDFFLFNRTAAPAVEWPQPTTPRKRRALAVATAALAILFIGTTAYQGWQSYNSFGDGAARHPLHGAYDVSRFTRGGSAVPFGEATRWTRVAISNNRLDLYLTDGSHRRFTPEYDAATGKLALTDREDATKSYALLWKRDADGTVHITGTIDGQEIAADATPRAAQATLLLDRGFQWVSEAPFNR